jgi:hypothetical protein
MDTQTEDFKKDLAQLFRTYGFGVEEQEYDGGPLYLTKGSDVFIDEDLNEIIKDAILKYNNAIDFRTT